MYDDDHNDHEHTLTTRPTTNICTTAIHHTAPTTNASDNDTDDDGKRLSRIALLLAEQSDRLGLHDDAARLFDLSGHDDRLAAYLNCRIQAISDLDQESPTDEEAAAVKERLRALASARDAAGLAGNEAGTTGTGAGGCLLYTSDAADE